MRIPWSKWLFRAGVALTLAALYWTAWRVWIGKPQLRVRPEGVPDTRTARQLGNRIRGIARGERLRSWREPGLQSRQAAWIAAKAEHCLHSSRILDRKVEPEAKSCLWVRDMWVLLTRARLLSQLGATEIPEEQGARLRAYWSAVDHSLQPYSVSVPESWDEEGKWPLIVQLHGHGWYQPFQGHPAPQFKGAFAVAPHGRGATDYMALGEDDVLAAIEEVCRDFPVDRERVYLRGGSMGGTGCWHLGTVAADRFAGICPIAGNADYLAWSARWGWNRPFPGRYDALRRRIQESHTARSRAGNLLHLPTYALHGSGDAIVPPEHARQMVAELRRLGCPVEYREFPGVGHGGFPGSAQDEALGWLCARPRETLPRRVRWSCELMRHGQAYWLRLERKKSPLGAACIDAAVGEGNRLTASTANLAAFSVRREAGLFDPGRPVFTTVDGERVIFPPGPADQSLCFRFVPGSGWRDQAQVQPPPIEKRAWLEGPIQEALMAPFALVLGTRSPDPLTRNLWYREVRAFAEEWKRRNGAPCPFLRDVDCTAEVAGSRNLILFGGPEDNSLSAVLAPRLPIRQMMHPLLAAAGTAPATAPDLNSPEGGWFLLYPNPEHPHRLVVLVAGNGPAAIYQSWGRFGNWFNWGVHDSRKYFDYAVFDARSASPESLLLVGWFGTDWSLDEGCWWLGSEAVRAGMGRQGFPSLKAPTPEASTLDLVDLQPTRIDQMRGAVGFGCTFRGRPLARGLGIRAPAFLEYELDGTWKEFVAGGALIEGIEVGMTEQRSRGERVRFVVKGDGKPLAAAQASWDQPEVLLNADLTGVRKLRLEATAEGSPAWLHMEAAWLAPRLYRASFIE
ncbi:MAG: prolyl oligopeptidase family serine peptidase [Lentisphaeria bacterium]|nr:prolyl oligopeptidase family serine peptidase [Lentisphaeria bacterium]